MKTLAIILLFSTLSFSQTSDPTVGCLVYEKLPTIIGGLDSLHLHLNWPASAKQFDIEGKVYVLAFLDSLGSLDSAQVVKGLGYGFDEEALRVINSAKYTPAYTSQKIGLSPDGKILRRLKPIDGIFVIPITFKLK